MLNEIQRFIRRYGLIRPGDTVVCAVSGGADSVALLFAMYLLREKLQIQVQAAHFDHRLRGAESDEDRAFVRDLCDRYDIPLTIGAGDVAAGKKGLEAAAREARYDFFKTLPGKIATAHTADDNAETVLLHLVRGTGLKGLGAIAPVRGSIIRPMLTVTREQVLGFLEEYHLTYRTDSSNETDRFLRNRLRHHVMPLLRQENPRLALSLSEMALRLRQDQACLEELSDPGGIVSVQRLRRMHPALRSRALERFLKESGVPEPEARHIRLAEKLVFSDDPSAQADLPGGITIARRYDLLEAAGGAETFQPVQICCPGEVSIPALGLKVVCQPAREVLDGPDAFTVDTQGPAILRPRQAGDRICLSGGSKSLKKLFIDRKIPAHLRPLVPVLCDDAGVLGVPGIGVSRDRRGRQWTFRFIKEENILTESRGYHG